MFSFLWCSIEVWEKGDERENQRNGWYLWEPKEWLLSLCYKQAGEPQGGELVSGRGFQEQVQFSCWVLIPVLLSDTRDRMWACSTGHVKDVTFVPLPEEKQKAMDSTQNHSVWFYYRKSHKTYLCKAAPWYLQHIQYQSFCPLFELTMEKLLLASCESFDSSLQVNFCFSWTDCWWLFLLFLSHKDNFIWRNLSCIQCAGPLHLSL